MLQASASEPDAQPYYFFFLLYGPAMLNMSFPGSESSCLHPSGEKRISKKHLISGILLIKVPKFLKPFPLMFCWPQPGCTATLNCKGGQGRQSLHQRRRGWRNSRQFLPTGSFLTITCVPLYTSAGFISKREGANTENGQLKSKKVFFCLGLLMYNF